MVGSRGNTARAGESHYMKKKLENAYPPENILESVFQVLPDLFFMIDSEGVIRDYRAPKTSDLYVPPEVFVGKNVLAVLPKSIGKLLSAAMEENRRTQEVVRFEYDLPYPDGKRRFECRLNHIGDTNEFSAVVRNITEQYRSAEALADSEARYRGLLENAPFPIIISKISDRSIRYANQRAKAEFGAEGKEEIGMHTEQFYHNPDDQKRFFNMLRIDGYVNDMELQLTNLKSEPFWALLSAAIVEFEKNPSIMISVNNINARKAAELELQQERTKLFKRVREQKCQQNVFTVTDDNNLPLGSVLQQVVSIMQEGLQYPEITCVQISHAGLTYGTDDYLDTPWMLSSENTTAAGSTVRLSVAYREERPAEDEGPFFKEERLLLDTILNRLTDIINRRHAAEIINEQDDLVRIMFDQTTDGIVLIDPITKRFISSNSVAYKGLGYTESEFAELTLLDLQAEHSTEKVEELMAAVVSGMSPGFETKHRTKSGEIRDVSILHSAIRIGGKLLDCASWRDITEIRKQAKAQQHLTEQLQMHTRLLQKINGMQSGINGEIITFAEEITELLGKELGIDRVSIWSAQPDEEHISCLNLYDTSSGQHIKGLQIEKSINSDALEYLKLSRYINADDAQNDPRTKNISDSCRNPLSISSLLDCSIEYSGVLNGILSFEYVNRPHIWQTSEISFGCEVADQIGMAYLNRDRLATSRSLLQNEYFLKRAQAVSKTGHWHLDILHDKLTCSEETCRIFGFASGSALTLSLFYSRVYSDDLPMLQEAFQRAKLGDPFCITHRIVVNGAVKWIEKRTEIEFDANNQPVICLGTVQDITAQVSAAQELDQYRLHLEEMVRIRTAELETAKAVAEAANRAKDSFLSNMSHEIRTPMNAIVGFTYLLRRDPLTPRQLDELDKLSESSRHLLQLINDILDLSKIEANKVTLDIFDFEPARIIDRVCKIAEEDAAKKNLHISINLDHIPQALSGDGNRLSQILLNLLTNAVKFTEKGSIVISGEVLEKTGKRIILRLKVQDTGIGLTPEQISRLFLDFEQATNSTTRHYGGTGLGLSICKRLTELMGGTVGVESEFGTGSSFWVDIPFDQSSVKPAVPTGILMNDQEYTGAYSAESIRHELKKHAGAAILLAEDNPINQEVASGLLELVRLHVSIAENGQSAVEMARCAAYDLILMDLQMPVMDGLEAAKIIRTLPNCRTVPIIAMTAVAFEEDRINCLKAGMNDYLAKPVDPDALYKVILKWLGPAQNTVVTNEDKKNTELQETDLHTGIHTASAAPDIMSALQSIDGLNAEFGLKNLVGDIPWYTKLIEQFITRHLEDTAAMRTCLKANDMTTIQRMCHSLKGTSSTLGFTGIQKTAIELEKILQAGKSKKIISSSLKVLDDQLHKTYNDVTQIVTAFRVPPEASAAANENFSQISALLAELSPLLENHDTAANDLFENSRDLLLRAIGYEGTVLENQIQMFDYDDALQTLNNLTRKWEGQPLP